MIEDFEFSDTKQIRKTLLITSFVGICFKVLVKNSTGNIEFLGFKIPIADANVLPMLIGCIIIFEIFALVIRYSDEKEREKYKKYLEYIKNNPSNILKQINGVNDDDVPKELQPNFSLKKVIKAFVVFLDIIFPILLGLFALAKIFLY